MPALSAVGNNWIFEGQIENLGTEVEGTEVCEESRAELLFLLRVGDPMALRLARYVRTVAPDGNDLRERELDLLGSKIRFSYEGCSRHAAGDGNDIGQSRSRRVQKTG